MSGGIFGSGGLNISSLVMQGAMAAVTGGSSLMVTTALRGVMMAVGDQVLQQLGQQMGLPPAVTDMASAIMHAEAGDVGGAIHSVDSAYKDLGAATGTDAFQTGQMQQQGFDATNWLMTQLLDKLQHGDFTQGGNGKAKAAAAKGGGATGTADAAGSTAAPGGSDVVSGSGDGESFLLKLAEALGKVIDSKMDEMVKVAGDIDKDKAGGGSQTATLSAKETALGQEVSLISNALNTAIKSLGDAASTLARKS